MEIDVNELYYYCPGCNKFHTIDGDKTVDKKLCFVCGVTKLKNTKILHFSDGTSTQMCDQCLKNRGITKEDIKKYFSKKCFIR